MCIGADNLSILNSNWFAGAAQNLHLESLFELSSSLDFDILTNSLCFDTGCKFADFDGIWNLHQSALFQNIKHIDNKVFVPCVLGGGSFVVGYKNRVGTSQNWQRVVIVNFCYPLSRTSIAGFSVK